METFKGYDFRMRYQRVDLNALAALDALLAERSVTRAAERMHVTQSAMSGTLARLREYFDDALLVPVGRTMQLTPRAESLIQPVKDILLRVDSTLGVRPQFDPASDRRHFVITASDYVAHVVLAELFQRIARIAPGLSFELHPTGGAMTQDLDEGRVDLIIVPAHLVIADHPQETLFDDAYKVIACSQHPVLKDQISVEQYQSMGHVVFQNVQGHNPWFDQWYANQHGASRRVELVTHSFALLAWFVLGTQRIATVQARLARHFQQSMPIKVLPPPMETPRLTEVLQWHRYRQEDPGIQWVREQMVEAAARLPPV